MKSVTVLLMSGLLSSNIAAVTRPSVSDNDLPISVAVKNSRFLVTDDDGLSKLEEELNAAGNQSVQIEVRESTLTTYLEENGDENAGGDTADADGRNSQTTKPKSRISGKVVIIDANGKRKEFQFNGDQARVLQSLQHPAISEADEANDAHKKGDDQEEPLKEAESEERYVLGVQCEEASELLRSHLKLGDNGLVILEIREGTPAAEAGLQIDDIIVSINGKDLKNVVDLVEAVSASEGNAVKLSILRAGDRQEMSVTPRKMQVPRTLVPAVLEMEEIQNLLGKGAPEAGKPRIHAGVLLGHVPGEEKDVQELIEKLRQMAENSENTSDTKSRITITAPETGDVFELKTPGETESAVKELQEQVHQLQEQLNELQKKLQSSETQIEK